jgi:Gp19/Gp15/Gp42-like protein
MPTYATPDDVRDVWDGDATDDRLNRLLARVETMLARRVPDLAQRITDGTTDAGMVTIVVSNVVKRFLDNPRGYVGEHAGEVGYYFAQGAKNTPSGQLSITEGDLADLGLNFTTVPRSAMLRSPALDRAACGYRSEADRVRDCW